MHDYQPPRDVIERLREIDPQADLLYVGSGKWMLGVYRPGQYRMDFARKQLYYLTGEKSREDDLPPWAVVAKYRKMQDGFAPVLIGEAQNGLFGEMIRDFRVADWFWRNRPDEKFEENLNATDTSTLMHPRMEQMADFADSEAGSVWRHTHKHPVSIVKPTRKVFQ
jgi:hypothetical protein